MRSILRRRAHGRRAGVALVEFALAAPFLLLLLAGTINYGLALRTATAVSAAARAGAAYGSASLANSTNTTGIQAAATSTSPDVKNMTVSTARSCQCPGGAAVNCGGSCTGNMLIYVQVTVTATSPPLSTYAGLGFSGAIKAQASMRAQ
jgi:Flp pilus assembly protein TadG